MSAIKVPARRGLVKYIFIVEFFRFLVSACINVTLFGVAVVFMILAATNLNDIFVKVPLLHFSPCFYMIIITVIEIPVVWLGTPKDFW